MVTTKRWIRLRSDGTVKINTGYAAIGGVLRDHSGTWIFEFNRRLVNVMFLKLNYGTFSTV
ncbi:hypothetical protein PVK06_025988 [Gossypium arboreum]|uniref:RNase H type-1 domain-containing protein n=1 Tax=Gossypium arboreum TaxID=29729 RepID=A0ABR0NYV3_GOSAR|nr:hypothetical protein PVK06_025988 [Gossypium arboreum]